MLKNYWPDAESINTCIKNEAEALDEVVLLAVHQPAYITQRKVGNERLIPASEQKILEEFTTTDVPSGTVIMQITGASGAGKSHMIRWLHAHLNRHEHNENYHIIRIPKGASLRRVVELILEPLKEDSRYSKLFKDVHRAISEVNEKQAAVTFGAYLENELSNKYNEFIAEARKNPNQTELKQKIGFAKNLPKLFTDAAFQEYFRENVFKRILARALKGRSEDLDESEEISRFLPEDFDIPKDIEIDKAAESVRNFYYINIKTKERNDLKIMVELLNSVVDSATNKVFQLEKNTGGVSFQDIIVNVRKLMLEDGKDLVLLIEDFAALTGIQDALLNICIKEGFHDGKQTLATMRTAIALTDGFLHYRDTIKTRAKCEWIVGGEELDDSQLKDAVVDLVGSYIDVARFGRENLEFHFKNSSNLTELDWLPVWKDEDSTEEVSEIINAFGSDSKGRALFPFNKTAIYKLVDETQTKGGKLIYNPRRIINEIIRGTVLEHRESFVKKQFPTKDFFHINPVASIASFISGQNHPPAIKDRLRSLYTVWGGNLSDVKSINIPKPIFEAFNLPASTEQVSTEVASQSTKELEDKDTENVLKDKVKIEIEESKTKIIVEKSKVSEEIKKLERLLDDWSSQKSTLDQMHANNFRKYLMEMVKDSIDWTKLRIREVPELQPEWIEIPNARGNQHTKVKLCENSKDIDGKIRGGLIAVFRYVELNNKKWNYTEADEDYVKSKFLVDKLANELLSIVMKENEEKIAIIVQTMTNQARILGLNPSKNIPTDSSILETLFSDIDYKEQPSMNEKWNSLYDVVSGNENSTLGFQKLQNELLEKIGTYQGITGKRPLAIDLVRLIDSIKEHSTEDSVNLEKVTGDLQTTARKMRNNSLFGQISSLVKDLVKFQSEISEMLDEGFDIEKFCNEFQDVIRLLGESGASIYWPINASTFGELIEKFRNIPIRELKSQLEAIIENNNRENTSTLLNILGSFNQKNVEIMREFIQNVGELYKSAEVEVRSLEKEHKITESAKTTENINSLLMIAANADKEEIIK